MKVRRSRSLVITAVGLLGVAVLSFNLLENRAATVVQQPLEKPPEGQSYVGAKKCSACHFDQLLDWKSTKHAKAFDVLPAKYKTNSDCLKCHTTGHGEESGYKGKATPDLVGASCESCHGPGSAHADIAKTFGDKKLTEEEQLYVRSTIHKIRPDNVCVSCHLTRAHQKHPDYDKK